MSFSRKHMELEIIMLNERQMSRFLPHVECRRGKAHENKRGAIRDMKIEKGGGNEDKKE
jgi:hypothetical protein